MIHELINYYTMNGSTVFEQFVRHFLMSFYGVSFAAVVSIPLGFYMARHRKLAPWVMRIAKVLQTIPSLAMLSILMVLVGLGPTTVVITVFIYSILPILNNTYTGICNVDSGVLDVAKGMGMTSFQMIYRVELPLSISIIIGGVRNALVVAIGISAVGTFIGAGGLGDIISRGINVTDGSAIIWAGTLPTVLMAVVSDVSLGLLEKKLKRT